MSTITTTRQALAAHLRRADTPTLLTAMTTLDRRPNRTPAERRALAAVIDTLTARHPEAAVALDLWASGDHVELDDLSAADVVLLTLG